MWKGAIIFALALAGIASTAVAERPLPRAVQQSDESTSTTTTTDTITTWETITITVSPSPTTLAPTMISSSASITVTSSTSSTLAPPETGSSTSSSSSSTPVTTQQHAILHQNEDTTSTVVETVVATVIAQPIVTVYVNPSNAAAAKHHARAINTLAMPAVLHAKRDDVLTATSITQFSTSTVPETTVTMLMTGPPPPVATGFSYTTLPVVPASAPSSVPLSVTVTTATAFSTVTSPTSGGWMSFISSTASPLQATVTRSTTTCANHTSSTSWPSVNISTFVATGLNLTWSSSFSSTTTITSWSSITSPSSAPTHTTTTKRKTTLTDLGLGPGATTIAPARNGSGKTIDVGGLPVPVAMIVGVVACFALALFL